MRILQGCYHQRIQQSRLSGEDELVLSFLLSQISEL